MKSFLSLATALTILFSFQAAQAAGPTYVRDNITVPTVWSAVNSPYVIQNDIVVAKGAVLTIEPGVEVRFVATKGGKVGAGPNLVVQGGLKAIGNSATPIRFAPYETGSLWGAIYFAGSDSANSLLQGCMIQGGRVAINSCSPTITQCALYGAKSGVEVYANSQARIVRNRITANGYGVILMAATASPVITDNDIYNNNFGFYFKDFGSPDISGNRIYNNRKYNMVNYSAKTIPAPNNDFRIADARQIVRTIYDGAYNARFGRVNFIPYVGMPSDTGTTAMAAKPGETAQEPEIQEDEFWGYGRPFDAMKISNLEEQKKKPSSTVKILAVGATAVVTAVLLFL